ncbi:TPA: hypothetical protein I7114_15845 [Vibrio vulnificus]|uniref:hypothetical protein n=1 Tax=Vibrio vulnificus TaxID=672 RepID=UPI0019D4D2AA|nr:hypothetical protein [Vibrio vulnificus]MBN8105219.1 hypothetical protein [Vibrio vulnificus]HAS6068194.1 hypothetical protein [Vibrio vulnificus]
MRQFVLWILVLFLAGCATPSGPRFVKDDYVPPGKAVIYIYRLTHIPLQCAELYVGARPIGCLSANEYIRVEVEEPGEIPIFDPGYFDLGFTVQDCNIARKTRGNEYCRVLDTKAGGIYYVRWDGYQHHVNPTTGLAEIRGTFLSGNFYF